MLLEKYKTKCYICQKEIECYSGFENWSILKNSEILSMCKDCSEMVEEYIEERTNNH
jgi:hypothetical protein